MATPARQKSGRRVWLALLLLSLPMLTQGAYRGHLKYQALAADDTDTRSPDQSLIFRLGLSSGTAGWDFVADYQLLVEHGEPATTPDDQRRALDLSADIHHGKHSTGVHRLDRLSLGYTLDNVALRAGRQAVSWGNGLVYNPMDFFNPFDPLAVDREYKTGDDMVYLQYLRDSGDDLQAVWVLRRDENGELKTGVSSAALKYHSFGQRVEVDLLVARHYDRPVLGLGIVASPGDAVWRTDLVSTRIDRRRYHSWVTNLSYAWTAWGHNLSGAIEYYRNGFGIANGDYGAINLLRHPELTARIARGELFSLGRHLLALNATMELTPLWVLTVSLIDNLDDDSGMLHGLVEHSLGQDLSLRFAVDLPLGSDAGEFGALPRSFLMQLGRYF